MSLKMQFTTENGFTVSKEDSYLKVTHLSGNKDNMFSILEYQNSARKKCGEISTNFIPSLNPEAGDFIHQAYESFKNLNELLTSEDS
jgi:hypothetical protein